MMRLRNLTDPCAIVTVAAFIAGCGGGAPAADSTMGASPVRDGDSASVPVVSPTVPDVAPVAGTERAPAPDPGIARPRVTTPGSGASPRAPQGRDAAADTVRGIVSEVGSSPMTSVVVRPASGGAVTITGALAREIARAAGAEVWVSGERRGGSMDVRSYAIRTVDGEAATDGIIARDGERLLLVTGTGPRPIARPLHALRGMIGARVWLVGPLDGTITSYGVLREP